ncbi:hypothetical protein QJS10_CPA07g00360 [Acorus calamus]|uniref:Uncharacterized protein n=1 Tax=Acorus calamus TaxID=4465 RepID=A0AAV9EH32_ACOCL|nr:hypothetical protein QJS10_CPA07g00360 [Acorus calamus]
MAPLYLAPPSSPSKPSPSPPQSLPPSPPNTTTTRRPNYYTLLATLTSIFQGAVVVLIFTSTIDFLLGIGSYVRKKDGVVGPTLIDSKGGSGVFV